MGGNRLRHVKRFAETYVALVRMDLNPEHVGKFGQIDGVDGGNFHVGSNGGAKG